MPLSPTELYNKENMNLIPVGLHEPGVQGLFEEAAGVVQKNLEAPRRYVKFYDQYFYLVDGTAEIQLGTFLEREPNYKVGQ